MRDAFCQSMIALGQRSDIVFMTGDLGYAALEPLQAALGTRFINAGVSEQNMVTAGAGLASEGRQVWLYSIAPFIYARPFEQVRNDICIHGLDVKLVGNGGGYGYGSMGATHHALEDYGILLTLKGLRAFVPVYDEDVAAVIDAVHARKGPAYLRLGRGEKPKEFTPPAYAPWRQLLTGGGPLLIACGPLAGAYHSAWSALPEATRPQVWALAELPVDAPLPAELQVEIQKRGKLAVAEEHVAQGGAAASLLLWLASLGGPLPAVKVFAAKGYLSGTYGSQVFHRKESGLDPESVLKGLA